MHRVTLALSLSLACSSSTAGSASDSASAGSSTDDTAASGPTSTGEPTTTGDATTTAASTSATTLDGATTEATTIDATGTSAATTTTGEAGPPDAAQLLALTADCLMISNGGYQSDDDDGAPADIPVCGLAGAVFWTADMDIDCDGKMSAQCNPQTDGAYQDQTSAEDSQGDPLDAASLPYVVVPLPSARFDYTQGGLALGSVIAVIYQGQVRYGVFGDEGPENIIGEASYAMAASLGIDPDPAVGGSDGPVTYIAFTGPAAVVRTMEDHDEAVQIGEARAAELLQNN